jgi:hypothetical protein
MVSVELTYDPDRARMLYSKYFAFERRNEIRKVPLLSILIVGLVVISIGLITSIDIWFFLGLLMIGITALYLLYYLLKFQFASRKNKKAIEKSMLPTERKFRFSFDENGMEYETENTTQRVKWALIKYYRENQGDLYLYLENHSLFDIISESILGKLVFDQYMDMLREKAQLLD